jgi:Dyp-type peroxidase family
MTTIGTPPTANWADVQGLVLSSHRRLAHARYSLWSIADAGHARRWLRALLPSVTHAHARDRLPVAVQVAFTHSGLTRLAHRGVRRFPSEFVQGMAGDPHRSRALGDVEESAPCRWTWGGPHRPAVDLLLMHFSETPMTGANDPPSPPRDALHPLAWFDSLRDSDEEPFGFADGVSQPILEGTRRAARQPDSRHIVRLGEVLGGYRDNAEETAPVPAIDSHDDFGTNGAFLVARQLEQNVDGFNRFVRDEAARLGMCPQALAEKIVGRTKSGLVLTPADVEQPERHDNEFGFGRDRFGEGCPLGAHIRRGNPRDTLHDNADDSWRVVNRHRLIRRGRTYRENGIVAGLFFIALAGSIERQFEFVQQNWINDPGFAGLSAERDPLVGAPGGSGVFTIPGNPLTRHVRGGHAFVTTRGGEYFFLPAIHALEQLAS